MKKLCVMCVLCALLLVGTVACANVPSEEDNPSTTTTTGSGVQVIIDDGEKTQPTTSANLDDEVNDWQNNTPSVDLEVESTTTTGSTTSSTGTTTTPDYFPGAH